jgi:hypothetical protein
MTIQDAAALATIFAAVTIPIALFLTYLQMLAGREAGEAAARPYVNVTLRMERNQELYIDVVNDGASMAQNVKMEFTPPLQSTMYEIAELPLWGNVAQLPPKRSISTLLDLSHRIFRDPQADQREASGPVMPLRYGVNVSYDSPITGKSYKEDHELDISGLEGLRAVRRQDIHEGVKVLDSLRKTVEKIERSLRS